MVTVADMDELGTQADEDTDNGFLNHKNPQLMMQNRQAFQALWGARPLVDDWRRMEAVRVNIVRQFEEEGEDVGDVDEAIEQALTPQPQQIEIDLSDIPFSPEEQAETRRMIASHEYEIGNVFFTSLAMPDSAARYYRRVMSRFPDSELAPQAIYSLSELYHSAGDTTQAVQYAMQLVDFYSNTIYAERMADRYNLELVREDFVMSREDSISAAFREAIALGPDENRAGELRWFADRYPESEYAPQALYRAVLDYIEAAREDPSYAYRIHDLATARFVWEQEVEEHEVFRDSIRALLADSAYMAVTAKIEENLPVDLRIEDQLETEVEPEADVYEPEHEPQPEQPRNKEPDMQQLQEQIPDTLEVNGDEAETEPVTEPDIAPEQEPDMQQLQEQIPDTLEVNGYEAETEPVTEPDLAPEQEPETERTIKTAEMHLREILEKPLPEPDFSELFPYEGALWDSARVALLTLRNEYSDFPRMRVVNALAEEIEVDRVRALLVDAERVYACNELDQRPAIDGGVDGFIDSSGFRDVINEHQISGTVVIQVLIDQEGVPIEVRTEEEDDDMGIMLQLLEAVEQHMRFSVPEFTGVPVQAECEYTIEFEYPGHMDD